MKLTVISASQKIFDSTEVQELEAPASEGIVGILPGHAPLISTLNIGELIIKLPQEIKHILLNGGYILVKNDEVTVLADEAHLPESLVQSEIAEAIQRAESKLSGTVEPTELIELERILRYERFKQQRANS